MNDAKQPILIPSPRSFTLSSGALHLAHSGRIFIEGDPAQLFPIASELQTILRDEHFVDWQLAAGGRAEAPAPSAFLSLDANLDIPAQGYELAIRPDSVRVSA